MILITGKNGFIGSEIFNFYKGRHRIGVVRDSSQANGYDTIACELTDVKRVKTCLKFFNPQIIIHCAGNSKTLPPEDHLVYVRDNLISTKNLIKFAPKGCRFIFLSTILVYGNHENPIVESDEQNPTSEYGESKSASEKAVMGATFRGDIKGINLRLTATIGAGSKKGIVYDFYNKINSNNPNLEMFGESPGSIKPMTHIDDVVAAIHTAVSNEDIIGSFNIAPEDSISALEIGQTMMETLGVLKPIMFLGKDTLWTGDNNKILIDNSKYKKCGWNPKFKTSKEAVIQATKDLYGTSL